MLVLADRLFFSYVTWGIGVKSGADLLWRIKTSTKLEVIETLADGSYSVKIYPSGKSRKNAHNGFLARLIEYRIKGKSELYRLITTMLDQSEAPAEELAALYSERWTIEIVYDELKNHTREKKVFLKSKTPELVIQ